VIPPREPSPSHSLFFFICSNVCLHCGCVCECVAEKHPKSSASRDLSKVTILHNVITFLSQLSPLSPLSPLLPPSLIHFSLDFTVGCVGTERQCPPVRAPVNVLKVGSGRTEGSKVTFSCDAGLTLCGAQMITCGANFLWSFPPPACAGAYPCRGQILSEVVHHRFTVEHVCYLLESLFTTCMCLCVLMCVFVCVCMCACACVDVSNCRRSTKSLKG
jgi:hypothetical protein